MRDGAGHRIPVTKVWVAWTSGSAGVKRLALVPACPPPLLTLLDLILSCLGKLGFQRCECEKVPELCFLCVGCVCKYTLTLCGHYSLLLAGSLLRLPLWIPFMIWRFGSEPPKAPMLEVFCSVSGTLEI